jgi:hypothetical protein
MDLGRQVLERAMENVSRMNGPDVARDRSLGENEADANTSAMTSGVHVTLKETTNGEGSRYMMEINPGCSKHDEYGDSDCTIKWGDAVNLRGSVYFAKPLEEGSVFGMKIVYKLKGAMFDGIDDSPPLLVSCPACGANCTFNWFNHDYWLALPDCPVQPGEYSYFENAFDMPKNRNVRSFEFEEDIFYAMKHADGTTIFTAKTHMETVSMGAGGGW